jgi:uncharacterized protein YlbG (UPF0298 family)
MEIYKNISYEDIKCEIWKELDGFDSMYQASNFGRIKNEKRIITQYLDKDGYCLTHLIFEEKPKLFRVHRLIAKSFISNENNKKQVNHKNLNRKDNRIENLEWVSASENNCHRFIGKKTSSIYRGVSYISRDKRWLSQIQINNQKINLGMFKTEEEAYLKRIEYEEKNNINNKYL